MRHAFSIGRTSATNAAICSATRQALPNIKPAPTMRSSAVGLSCMKAAPMCASSGGRGQPVDDYNSVKCASNLSSRSSIARSAAPIPLLGPVSTTSLALRQQPSTSPSRVRRRPSGRWRSLKDTVCGIRRRSDIRRRVSAVRGSATGPARGLSS